MRIFVILERGQKPNEANYGCYTPDAPGCITLGDTIEETLSNMKEALELYFEGEDLSFNPSPIEMVAKAANFNRGDLLASVTLQLGLLQHEAA